MCGLRTPADVAAAVASGADAIGFVLTASPRQVDVRLARSLAQDVPPHVLTVGVFAGEPVDMVGGMAIDAGVDAVQLHGGYRPSAYALLGQLPLRLIRAVTPVEGAHLQCGAYGEDHLVVDSCQPGSGHTWAWDSIDERPTGQWMLAGGLRVDNVRQAIGRLSPWGVDVSSGVERRRGVKDAGLIRDFVSEAKAAGLDHAAGLIGAASHRPR